MFTVGKFAVTDVFDTNQYAHDPRNDFFNWAAVDAGTYDYAADAWGFTVGAAVERYIGSWTFRAGVFDLSDVPNSPDLEPAFHEFQMDAEIEKRYPLFGQTGRILFTALDSRGRMGLLDQAIALGLATNTTPDPAKVRQYRSRMAEPQHRTAGHRSFGLFARLGKARGTSRFTSSRTSIARSRSAARSGERWHRPLDTVGVVFLDDGISAEREEYLNLGGLGILVGDGRLPHPGAEQAVETYYSLGARILGESEARLPICEESRLQPGSGTGLDLRAARPCTVLRQTRRPLSGGEPVLVCGIVEVEASRGRCMGFLHPPPDQDLRAVHSAHLPQHAFPRRGLFSPGVEAGGGPIALDVGGEGIPPACRRGRYRGHRRACPR